MTFFSTTSSGMSGTHPFLLKSNLWQNQTWASKKFHTTTPSSDSGKQNQGRQNKTKPKYLPHYSYSSTTSFLLFWSPLLLSLNFLVALFWYIKNRSWTFYKLMNRRGVPGWYDSPGPRFYFQSQLLQSQTLLVGERKEGRVGRKSGHFIIIVLLLLKVSLPLDVGCWKRTV